MVKTSQNRNSVKIVLDFTGASRLLGNNSVIPFLTAAKKRHFHPPKLPALRAEVDGLALKSVRPFSCFAVCGFSLCRNSLADVLFLRLPFPQRSRTSAQRLVFCCWMGTRLGWAAKAAQTANTGATDCDWRFVCALNLCFQQNRHIFVLPHPRPVSASVGHSPAGVPPELVGW